MRQPIMRAQAYVPQPVRNLWAVVKGSCIMLFRHTIVRLQVVSSAGLRLAFFVVEYINLQVLAQFAIAPPTLGQPAWSYVTGPC